MTSASPAPTGLRFEAYSPAQAARWNEFVARSRNATFLFDRGFMDYHGDRFEDASLLIHDGPRLVALLPAHRDGTQCISHGGLTYGGLLLGDRTGAATVLRLLPALQAHLARQGMTTLIYKTIPAIYHRRPCQEDLYALFRCGAELIRRDCVSAIEPGPQGWPQRLRRRITEATRVLPGLVVADDEDWAGYWALLSDRLQQRHGTRPVHSLAEIRLLACRFPEHIRLKTLRLQGQLQAGVVLFQTDRVLHAQYSAVAESAARGDLLALLFEACIAQAQAGQRWFDFGNSNEDQGRRLNEGLVTFKERLGATAIAHDFYRLRCAPGAPGAATTEE